MAVTLFFLRMNKASRILCLMFYFLTTSCFAQPSKEIIYVGTFSVRGSEGIYVYAFDRKNGTLQLLQTLNTLESPTFLAIHPSGKYLYSANRGNAEDRKNAGSISAYGIDQTTGKLTLLNHKSSYGNGPCHIELDRTGKFAFISHYTQGNLTVFRIAEDGSVGSLSDSIQFSGSSANKERQDKPHVHAAVPAPDNRFVMVTDLGTDKVYSFAVNLSTGKLAPAPQPFATVTPGSGPRHFTFHPNGKYAYLAEELSSTVCAFSYNKKNGALKVIQKDITTLPQDFTGVNSTADIHTDASGKYLFVSNRGHQSLSIYSIASDGTLKFVAHQNTKGEKPRNFLVDHKNQYIMVAHQDTDNIITFKWDPKTGNLNQAGTEVKVPSPVCLKMLTLK